MPRARVTFHRLILDSLDYESSDQNADHMISQLFFSLEVGGEPHVINFPYAASILARLRDENKKYRTATVIAIISLVVSSFSLAISLAW